jgi:Flp pilus assembly protein TadD
MSKEPDTPANHYNRGNDLLARRQLAEAISEYRAAIQLDPNLAQAWCNLGLALRASGDLPAAISAYWRAIELLPNVAEIHLNLGVALAAAGMANEAVAAWRRSIKLAPNLSRAHFNLANAMADADDLESAITYYQRAIQIDGQFAQAHSNLGKALMRIGRRDQAMAACNRAIELDPHSANPRWNRAIALLLQGDYQQGWTEFEWRHLLADFSPLNVSEPRWDGGSLAGSTILLHAEQGLGDTIQFVRYVPMVAKLGGRVILRCPRELVELFRGINGIHALISNTEALPPFDVHCPLMSLPKLFGTRLESIPGRAPYLAADPKRAQVWAERIGSSTMPRVGLAWAGSPLHQYDRQRSIGLASLSPLSRVAGVQWVSLQKGPAAAEIMKTKPLMAMCDHTAMLADFADTAALISQLDLVISVDTAVAHLAAAMGKPVWLLLPFAPDWRWLLDRDDSPWYPTIRLFRQSVRGDWTSVIEAVATQLIQWRPL